MRMAHLPFFFVYPIRKKAATSRACASLQHPNLNLVNEGLCDLRCSSMNIGLTVVTFFYNSKFCRLIWSASGSLSSKQYCLFRHTIMSSILAHRLADYRQLFTFTILQMFYRQIFHSYTQAWPNNEQHEHESNNNSHFNFSWNAWQKKKNINISSGWLERCRGLNWHLINSALVSTFEQQNSFYRNAI